MREMLVNYYEGNIVFSFNDLAILTQIVQDNSR